jgi:hypothetical protein
VFACNLVTTTEDRGTCIPQLKQCNSISSARTQATLSHCTQFGHVSASFFPFKESGKILRNLVSNFQRGRSCKVSVTRCRLRLTMAKQLTNDGKPLTKSHTAGRKSVTKIVATDNCQICKFSDTTPRLLHVRQVLAFDVTNNDLWIAGSAWDRFQHLHRN